MSIRNDLLAKIVVAAGGTVRNPYNRNMLLEDWLAVAGGVPIPAGAEIYTSYFDESLYSSIRIEIIAESVLPLSPSVNINGLSCTDVIRVNDFKLTCTSPAEL